MTLDGTCISKKIPNLPILNRSSCQYISLKCKINYSVKIIQVIQFYISYIYLYVYGLIIKQLSHLDKPNVNKLLYKMLQEIGVYDKSSPDIWKVCIVINKQATSLAQRFN